MSYVARDRIKVLQIRKNNILFIRRDATQREKGSMLIINKNILITTTNILINTN